MHAEIYDHIPISGSVEERHYDATGHCTWVRFVDNDGAEWAGVFGNGELAGHQAAAVFGDDRTVFVVAAGQGYVVDGVTRELIRKSNRNYLCDAISVPGRMFVIVCDYTLLYAFTRDGEVWQSERIALDGIRFDSTSRTALLGQVYHLDGWHPFRLTFDGWVIEGG